jgi:hypothetical protein
MFRIIISIIEAIYVVYMLNFYKSKTNYADPNITFTNAFLAHPKTHSDIPISMVCPAGNTISLLFGTYLIAREFVPCESDLDIIGMKILNGMTIFMGMGMSAMNLNVLLYLSPIFFIEIIRLLF